jgi:hypothetical protein
MGQGGVRCFAFMQRSIRQERRAGEKSPVVPHLFLLSALIGRQNFFPNRRETGRFRAFFLLLSGRRPAVASGCGELAERQNPTSSRDGRRTTNFAAN